MLRRSDRCLFPPRWQVNRRPNQRRRQRPPPWKEGIVMFTKSLAVVVVIVGGGMTGCASVKPQASFFDVQQVVSARLGKEVQWSSGSDADRAVAEGVDALLAKPLDADSAVQIALLGNRNLQATYG